MNKNGPTQGLNVPFPQSALTQYWYSVPAAKTVPFCIVVTNAVGLRVAVVPVVFGICSSFNWTKYSQDVAPVGPVQFKVALVIPATAVPLVGGLHETSCIVNKYSKLKVAAVDEIRI